MDLEQALLQHANEARASASEEEVKSLYRQLLKRPSCPMNIKKQAILNLTSYLVSQRGNPTDAIKVLDDYYNMFYSEPEVIKMYASYCYAHDDRNKAVTILRTYFTQHRFSENELNLELFGLLITYRSVEWLNQLDQMSKGIGEPRTWDKLDRDKMLRELHHIYNNEGQQLFNFMRTKRIKDFNRAATRQNVENGLYHLIRICLKIGKDSYARAICDYGINHFIQRHIKQSVRKIRRQLDASDYVETTQREIAVTDSSSGDTLRDSYKSLYAANKTVDRQKLRSFTSKSQIGHDQKRRGSYSVRDLVNDDVLSKLEDLKKRKN